MKKRASPENLARKEVQATLDRIPAKYREPIERQALAGQRGRNYDGHLAKTAQEIFKSMDSLRKFKQVVSAGAPKNTLFEAKPRPVNPRSRNASVKDYFFWMARREHPEFEKRVGYAVLDINGFRARMSSDGRKAFDAGLGRLLEERGHHPAQFKVHFPEVVQRLPFEPWQGRAPHKSRKNSYDKRPGE